MTNIEKIKAEMLSISKKTKLPEFYVEDLSKDLSLVETFSGHKLVWVLRTCGSALVPTKVGVHPTHVTHWIWGNSGQQIMTYSVDTLSGVIEKIDFEEAERMGHVRQGGVNSVAALRLGNAPVMRSVVALLSPHQRPGLSPPCSVEAGNGSAKAIPRSAPPAPRPVAA